MTDLGEPWSPRARTADLGVRGAFFSRRARPFFAGRKALDSWLGSAGLRATGLMTTLFRRGVKP